MTICYFQLDYDFSGNSHHARLFYDFTVTDRGLTPYNQYTISSVFNHTKPVIRIRMRVNTLKSIVDKEPSTNILSCSQILKS
jgi:hypothetical protein